MNKKFITLCVSALLAGGMVTPAFAADNIAAQKILSAYGGTMITDKHVVEGQYYLVRIHTSSDSNTGWNLHLTKSRAWVERGDEVSQYTLWQVVPVKVNGQLTNQFELVNAAGLKLSVGKDNSVGVNKDYSVFEISGVGSSGNALKLCNSPMTNLLIGQGSNGTLEAVSSLSNGNIKFEILEPVVLDAAKLNDKFLSSFTIGAGYYKDNEWISYADDHDLQGNEVFEGHLKATTTIGTSGYQFKQTLSSGEVYLWNGDKIVVLTNNKWSKMNNSLTGVDGTGYKFQLMTPTELANQEVADAADPSKAVIRSYVFKIAEPNVVTEAPLEVAAKIWDPSSGTWAATTKTWEELYVSEVNGNYYLTTAAAYEDNALSTNDYVSTLKAQLKADYVDDQVYVKFIDNNYVDAEHFFGYAWNIVRMNDGKTLNPEATTNTYANEWVDKETIGMTVPEGQWILRDNADKDDYEWANRETTKTITEAFALTDPTVDDRFSFKRLRVTTPEDEYYGPDYYRINEGDEVEYYKISKAKNAEGVEINLDAEDRFDYYGFDAKETSLGVDETYKIQFTNDVTKEVVYLGQNGVGQLLLTADPTAAIQFNVDTMKTTDNIVVVTDDDINANPDVFNIYNTYKGLNEDDEWVDKTDTVSFYRYNFKYAGKYLHFDANQGYVLVDPKSESFDAKDVDAFVIKEKGDDFINILNVDNSDFDNYFDNTTYGSQYNAIKGTDPDGEPCVAGNLLLAVKEAQTNDNLAATNMMYFDFNFAEARQQQNIYNWVANAQLKLDYQNYDIYRNVAPTAPDTMAIYRTEFDDEFMYERGEFLGVTYDRNGYNAALFIDTAYVRNNTEKPLFMIGVRPEITPMSTYCPEHGFNTDCPPQHLDTIPGYVDADYLTVLADSAAYHAAELQNPFLDDNAYTKLAFVAARHNVDTITVADSGAKATIVEGMQHPMVFAFRYANNGTDDFIIEGVNLKDNKKEFDAKENPYVTSYIRWNNGVPVMTENINDAEVFNITNLDETADPTANETIAAEGAVSVVATEGGVIVKGAEGKNVVVATILGKVVANETVNSDNETINTPAGIVVVSVDGESFKVVVK